MRYRRSVLSTNTGSVTFESFNRAGKQFVFTELDVAITFCRECLFARDTSKAARAMENARRAFRVALKKQREVIFSERERNDLAERVSQLKTLIREVARRKIPHTQ